MKLFASAISLSILSSGILGFVEPAQANTLVDILNAFVEGYNGARYGRPSYGGYTQPTYQPPTVIQVEPSPSYLHMLRQQQLIQQGMDGFKTPRSTI